MADSPTTTPLVLGPWKGIDQRGASVDHVRDSLNVEFTREGARRRKGRLLERALGGTTRITGLFAWVSSAGERRLVATRGQEASLRGATILQPDGTNTDFSLVGWDEKWMTYAKLAGGDWQEPVEAVAMNGHLVLAEPAGRLLDFDGTTLELLRSMEGKDAMLGLSGAATYLVEPPVARSVTVWRGRLVAASDREIGMSSEDDEFLVPEEAPIGGPNVWPAQSNFSLVDPESDEVATVLVHLDRLVVLGRRSLHVVDEDASMPVARCVSRTRGCLAPVSAQNAGEGVIYLSHGSIVEFDGTTARDIGEPICETLQKVNWQAAHGAIAVHVRKKSEYWLWLPVDGSAENTLCARFNYRTREWSLHSTKLEDIGGVLYPAGPGVTAACSFTDETGEETIYTGDSAGNVWAEDVVEGSDAGYTFPAWISLYLAPSGRSNRVRFSDLRARALLDGCYLGACFLYDGETREHAVARAMLNGATVEVPPAPCQEPTSPTWAGAGNYPTTVGAVPWGFFRLPLQEICEASEVVLLLPGAPTMAGTVDPSGYPTSQGAPPGCIQTLELTTEGRSSRAGA